MTTQLTIEMDNETYNTLMELMNTTIEILNELSTEIPELSIKILDELFSVFPSDNTDKSKNETKEILDKIRMSCNDCHKNDCDCHNCCGEKVVKKPESYDDVSEIEHII